MGAEPGLREGQGGAEPLESRAVEHINPHRQDRKDGTSVTGAANRRMQHTTSKVTHTEKLEHVHTAVHTDTNTPFVFLAL